jgi:hypothetical protein
MRPNLQRPCPQIADPDGELNETINQLISGHYFLVRRFRDDMWQVAPAGNRMGEAETWPNSSLFRLRGAKMPFASLIRFVYFDCIRFCGDAPVNAFAMPRSNSHLNLTQWGDTKSSMRPGVSCMRTSI